MLTPWHYPKQKTKKTGGIHLPNNITKMHRIINSKTNKNLCPKELKFKDKFTGSIPMEYILLYHSLLKIVIKKYIQFHDLSFAEVTSSKKKVGRLKTVPKARG